MTSGTLYRRSAFTNRPEGGNPAGVWIGETLPAIEVMQQIAAEVGYSETAFVAPIDRRGQVSNAVVIAAGGCDDEVVGPGAIQGDTEVGNPARPVCCGEDLSG